MGSYATTTSVSQVLVGYLDKNTTTTDDPGMKIFSKHIERAEGMVNSALARLYSLPFTVVPPLVRSLSEDIACYYVIRATYFQDSKMKNTFMDEFKEAFKTLEDISSGETRLANTDGSLVAVDSSSRYLSSDTDHTPIFGKDDPKAWQRDSDEIDETADSRD